MPHSAFFSETFFFPTKKAPSLTIVQTSGERICFNTHWSIVKLYNVCTTSSRKEGRAYFSEKKKKTNFHISLRKNKALLNLACICFLLFLLKRVRRILKKYRTPLHLREFTSGRRSASF